MGARAARRMTPEIGELVELLYPVATAKALAEVLGTTARSVSAYAVRRKIKKEIRPAGKPIGYTRSHRGYIHQKVSNTGEPNSRFAFAHVLAWEGHTRTKKPPGHVIIVLDGNRQNLSQDNLYCLPKAELLGWMRFIRAPVEVHVDRLWRKIMSLDSSAAVKQKLLDVLEQVVDPDQKPDLIRQRAVCETVQTLVNLLRVEVAYIDAVEGDGVIPFLEGVRQEAVKQRTAARRRKGLLAGPASDHPWRGLGAPGS